MKAGDKIRFRDARHPVSRGLDKAAIGVVVRTYDLPAHPFRVDVEFEGRGISIGWHQSDFILANPAG